MYAKVENGAIVAYPYLLSQLRADYPSTSFPSDESIQPTDISPFGVLPVVAQPLPVFDMLTQKLEQTFAVLGDHVEQGWVVQPTTPQERASYTARIIARIDSDADAITADVIGNRGVEYIEAEAQALAYQQAGYSGTVPSMVQAWVDAKAIEGVTWTATEAAEDILTQAVAWRSAVEAIRYNRLKAKAYVRIAANDADLEAATSTWDGFVQAVRSQLGV